MQTYRTSFLNVAALLILLCSACIVSRSATACVGGVYGPTSFTAAPGSSQSLTWTADNGGLGLGGTVSVSITAGSDVFTLSQMPVIISNYSANFTITFTPGANATGTFKGTLTCPCGKTYALTGTVAASGVETSPLSEVSISVTPNPATNYLTISSSGVRSTEIGIYDLLGKEITSSKNSTWKVVDNTASKNSTWICDASSVPTGSYIVRVVGQSFNGDPFIISRKIIIAR